MEKEYFEVYPCGTKLDLADKKEAVAWFMYENHALKYKEKYWPTTGEVRPIKKKDLIKKLK